MKNLYQLVYTSQRSAMCDEKEIQKIVASCRKNNPSRDVTGVLMYANHRFIQYLEGPKEEVRSLYDLIKGDPRHQGVMERVFTPIQERLFPSWHMGYKDLESGDLAYHTQISGADKKVFEEMIAGLSNYDDPAVRKLKVFFELA